MNIVIKKVTSVNSEVFVEPVIVTVEKLIEDAPGIVVSFCIIWMLTAVISS